MKQIDTIRAALELAREIVPPMFATHAKFDDALAALAELEKAVAEPVAWQYRLDGDCEWSQCTMRGFDTLVSIGECETRQLYTTPPPAPATPDQTLSALTAYKAQQGDEYVRMQAALQAAGESK